MIKPHPLVVNDATGFLETNAQLSAWLVPLLALVGEKKKKKKKKKKKRLPVGVAIDKLHLYVANNIHSVTWIPMLNFNRISF